MLLPATLPCPAAASAVQPLFAWKAFDELSAAELYSALQLRSEVFVAEQGRAYPEADGADPAARHLLALSAADGLAGYLRVLPPDSTGAAELGRVVVRPAARGGGLGRRLVGEALDEIARLWGPVPVALRARRLLAPFYGDFGFRTVGLLERDRVAMLRTA